MGWGEVEVRSADWMLLSTMSDKRGRDSHGAMAKIVGSH